MGRPKTRVRGGLESNPRDSKPRSIQTVFLSEGRNMNRIIVSISLFCLSFLSLLGSEVWAQENKAEASAVTQEATTKPGKEKGEQARFFAYSLPKVKAAMVSALNSNEFEVKKEEGNELEAKHKRHVGAFVGSGGETLIVNFQEAEEGGAKGTHVSAETKKGFVGRAGQKSWSDAVLDEAERILKEGK